jgi:hypothetical protein
MRADPQEGTIVADATGPRQSGLELSRMSSVARSRRKSCGNLVGPNPEEIKRKRNLYFAKGAWSFGLQRAWQYELLQSRGQLAASLLCPDFPNVDAV